MLDRFELTDISQMHTLCSASQLNGILTSLRQSAYRVNVSQVRQASAGDQCRSKASFLNSQVSHVAELCLREGAMLNLLKEIIKNGEMTVKWNEVSAKGGLPVMFVFIVALIVLLR
jgi:hypothetical protein